MAKPVIPAEASLHARRAKPVQRAVLGASAGAPLAGPGLDDDARGLELRLSRRPGDDAHDTARDLTPRHAPAGVDLRQIDVDQIEAGQIEVGQIEVGQEPPRRCDARRGDELLAEDRLSDDMFSGDLFSGEDAIDDADLESVFNEGPDAAPAVGARRASAEPRPGLAWVRQAAASASRAPKLPMASLDPPSTSQLDLTPSPVPRVALAAATGAVDISLVPGPHQVGSRNLPTLAAQHLRARPRRPAPAMAAPPPAPGLPPSRLSLARDVRSSKGEIVLGLTIGLGVSLLLAGLGQAYLRGDVVADEQSSPGQLESLTLSARPDPAPPADGSGPGAAAPGAPPPGEAVARGPSRAEAAAKNRAASQAAGGEQSLPANAAATAAAGSTSRRAPVLVAQNSPTRAEGEPARATPSRARRAASGARGSSDLASASSASALDAVRFERGALERGASDLRPSGVRATERRPTLGKPSQPGSSSATPLTPAESAGLGLDLPL